MAKLNIVKTAQSIIYVVAGKVTLAKCAITGRFTKKDDAQWLIDNMIACALNTTELTKAVFFYKVSFARIDTRFPTTYSENADIYNNSQASSIAGLLRAFLHC